MPLLNRAKLGLVVGMAAIGLSGCGRGSPEYKAINHLPYSQWRDYAASLPIDKRLDLSNEIRERSWHTPKNNIEDSFSNEPYYTYKAIIKRIRNQDNSRYYLGIIYDIDGKGGFKICNQPDRKILQMYLSGIARYPGHQENRPDFYNC